VIIQFSNYLSVITIKTAAMTCGGSSDMAPSEPHSHFLSITVLSICASKGSCCCHQYSWLTFMVVFITSSTPLTN